jgi:hypothetical protein
MAARPASVIRDRSTRESKTASSKTIYRRFGAVGQPQLRSPRSSKHQSEFPDVAALVVAYALAGTVIKDVNLHPIGQDPDGNDVYLKDIWASLDEVKEVLQAAFDPETYKNLYRTLPSRILCGIRFQRARRRLRMG